MLRRPVQLLLLNQFFSRSKAKKKLVVDALEIVVCLKHVYDEKQIKINKSSLELNFENVPTKISDDDKNAIEEAVRLKDSVGGTVTAITLGEPDAKKSLREAMAMGCDRSCLIYDPIFSKLDAVGTAKVLASGIRKLGNFDLILCATATTDLYTGLVGPCIAETLNLPLLSYASRLVVKDGSVEVSRDLEDVTEILECKAPVVVTVSRGINEPRLPTLLHIMAAAKKPLVEFSAKDVDYKAEDFAKYSQRIEVQEVKAPRIGRRRQLIEGDPKEVTARIVDVLRKEGLIP